MALVAAVIFASAVLSAAAQYHIPPSYEMYPGPSSPGMYQGGRLSPGMYQSGPSSQGMYQGGPPAPGMYQYGPPPPISPQGPPPSAGPYPPPSGPPAPPPPPSQPLPPSYFKQATLAVLKSIENHDTTPAMMYMSVDEIDHSAAFSDGQAAFVAFLQSIANATAKVNTVRTFYDEEEKTVFTHGMYVFPPALVAFDVFRFDGRLMVEHWDNLELAAAGPNPSAHTQLDGTIAAKVLAPAAVKANKALVKEFVIQAVIAGDATKIPKYVSNSYIEHAVDGTDGIAALTKAISSHSNGQYNRVELVLGDGNFVLIAGQGVKHCAMVAFYDLYRVEASKIVEHWSVTEDIPAQNEWKNENGKF